MIQETAKKFREWYYKNFQYQSGFFFNASAFSGVSAEWGVGFTIWSEGKTTQDPKIEIKNEDASHYGW